MRDQIETIRLDPNRVIWGDMKKSAKMKLNNFGKLGQ